MEKILITGASGFVGKTLAHDFLENGWQVTGLGTSPFHPFSETYKHFTWVQADTTQEGEWQNQVGDADVIVNLAGRNIFKRWTVQYKKAIYDSRILTTKNLVSAMNPQKNRKFLSTSAAGVYGDAKEDMVTEQSPPGNDFLAHVCKNWENEAEKASDKGISLSVMRFGVILGDSGGALSLMAPAFKWCLGGPLGSGQQWFPWIHIKDLARAVDFLINNMEISGVFNFTSPGLVRQKTFAKALGSALNRPAAIPAPVAAVKLFMGEMGGLLLNSQRAFPEQLVNSGFKFQFQTLEAALADLYK